MDNEALAAIAEPRSEEDLSLNSIAMEITREVMDQDGDILIQAGAKEFLVSSKILILASPVFRAMLKPSFHEGSAARSTQNPLPLSLPDDDPWALSVVLKILHFIANRDGNVLTVDGLFDVTQLCDKYDLKTSMQCYMGHWTRILLDEEQDVLSLQKLCSVALLANLAEDFSRATRDLALRITDATAFIELGEVPESLQHERANILASMTSQTEMTILGLRNKRSVFATRQKLCLRCERVKPIETKKCGNCASEDFTSGNCDAGSRICDLLEALKSKKLLPLTRQAGKSPSSFLTNLKSASLEDHFCEGKTKCPLLVAASALRSQLEGVVKNFSGLNLRDFRDVN